MIQVYMYIRMKATSKYTICVDWRTITGNDTELVERSPRKTAETNDFVREKCALNTAP